MDALRDKVAVVTGASSGIGKAIAKRLVAEGLLVVGLARRIDKLEALALELNTSAKRFHPVRADVTVEEDIKEAFLWTDANLGPVHVLVNNAGVMRPDRLTDGATATWRQVLDTNVLAVAVAAREAIANMKANLVDGHIVQINSVLGHRILYGLDLNVYPASKYAVTAMTHCLRQELAMSGSRIRVSSVSPGMCDSGLAEASGIAGFRSYGESHASLDCGEVANAVVYVLGTSPNLQVTDLLLQAVGDKS